MERDILFREVLVTSENEVSDQLPMLQFELSAIDVDKYQGLIRAQSKTNKDPNDLTNKIFFGHMHTELKSGKLKATDKEYLKNQWLDVYYQVVLPLLGIKKERSRFKYPILLKQRLDKVGQRFDSMYDLLLRTKAKSIVPADFDDDPQVTEIRKNARNLLYDEVIPMLVEGLNLNDPDKIYRALFTLDEGRLVDTLVDIMTHNPALLPPAAKERYDRTKLLLMSNVKNEIIDRLKKRSPSPYQTGPEPQRAKGENVRSKPLPDRPKYNVTGRFEFVNKVDTQQPLGLVLCLNQAGNWIEGILSVVGNPQLFTDNPKFFYRFYAAIKDWASPNPMFPIRSTTDAFKAGIQLVVQNNKEVQILLNDRSVDFKRVWDKPILTERHLVYFRDNPLARQTQWFQLLTVQLANIKAYFKQYIGYLPILKYPKYGTPAAARNRTLNIKQLIISAAKGDMASLDIAVNCLDQFLDENIHESDKDIAGFYIRRYLNQIYFDKGDGWRLTLTSWLYRQIRISKKYQNRKSLKWIYGTTGGDSITPVSNQLYQYRIAVKVVGFGVGYFIKGGYYRGEVTIRCKQWEELGAKDPKGKREAELKIQMGELGGGYVKSINFGQSFGGVAESDILWMPKDFEGLISVLKFDGEVGIDLVSIRKKLGISGAYSGTIGLMEIVGNANLPPLMFGIYSLGPTVGGIEPEIDRESGIKDLLGPEVAGSVVVGSIWQNGPLPAPKDVLKYGNEKAVLEKTYISDEKAHFKHDSAVLTIGAINLLRKLCANEMAIITSPSTTIIITGHTDRSGKDEYNKTLSQNRAENVKQKLLDICGDKYKPINASKVFYEGEKEAVKYAAAMKTQGTKAPEYDPRFRKVEITINGKLVLTLISD
ncbi:MAG TPA: OmpA family protein [Flavisolibacter sp.]|nr:OmpA family protein [Flavisolibacter sp.]